MAYRSPYQPAHHPADHGVVDAVIQDWVMVAYDKSYCSWPVPTPAEHLSLEE